MLSRFTVTFTNVVRNGIKHFHSKIDISEEVGDALRNGKAVVSLESTIVTHGMPYPENYKTAVEVENVVRSKGAVPATIAIVNGKIKVGLRDAELKSLATRDGKCIKVSRRDLPYVITNRLNGGTTVAATMIISHMAGIPIFVTGGIGGVHRSDDKTWDVSADLTELGRTPVAVISAGVKSILDIGNTLEYLETEGVPVTTFSSDNSFPSFYSKQSPFKSPYFTEDPHQAARMINTNLELGLRNGMLFTVPIPDEFHIDDSVIEKVINEALTEAKKLKITGKEVTPFLLSKISELTAGKSLAANIGLIKNNATVGAEIAVQLAGIRRHVIDSCGRTKSTNPKVVVVGASIADCVTAVQDNDIKNDGRTYNGRVSHSAGGVGRNIADALSKLNTNTCLISAVGNDQFGTYLLNQSSQLDTRGVLVTSKESTATSIVFCSQDGDCKFIVGDFKINKQITKQHVKRYEDKIVRCKLLVVDGNLQLDTLSYLLDVCNSNQVPVWFEPTDINTADKAFIKPYKTNKLSYISPNLNEARVIHGVLFPKGNNEMADNEDAVSYAKRIANEIAQVVDHVLVTLGQDGVLIVNKTDHGIQSTVYKTPYLLDKNQIVNVSGAGDCFAAGFIHSMVSGYDEQKCVQVGFQCAMLSLMSATTVPKTFDRGFRQN